MFSYENYLPYTAFNESSIFFKASEVFRYGFLIANVDTGDDYCQLYSYHNYYVEVTYADNYEEIKSIEGLTVDESLDKYLNPEDFVDAYMDLFRA